uniref:Ribosomal protein S1 n=1 Tax=Callithamnion tetricum TaxID=193179 RepID=A0A4D6WNZ8_9FLOR|nr:ribosomal protein S1 [Callithamnion tetricum]
MNKNKKNNAYNYFASMLMQYNYNLNTGDIVAGKIFSKEKQYFLVAIGDQIVSYLPFDEISLLNEYNKNINDIDLLHTTREFFILNYNINTQKTVVSLKRIEYIRGWQRIKQLQKEDIVFNIPVYKINKGGIITFIEKIQGFIPNSHIFQINTIANNNNLTQKIICNLLLSNEKNNQIILSNKSAMLYLAKHQFKLGEIIYGTIVQIQKYGLFIKIYNILALLHISEISSKYIHNIYNMFKLGNIIKVKIIHINIKQGRLSVSTRYIK